jgi:hypothetical protein
LLRVIAEGIELYLRDRIHVLALALADGEILVLADGDRLAECSAINRVTILMIRFRRRFEYWESPETYSRKDSIP